MQKYYFETKKSVHAYNKQSPVRTENGGRKYRYKALRTYKNGVLAVREYEDCKTEDIDELDDAWGLAMETALQNGREW